MNVPSPAPLQRLLAEQLARLDTDPSDVSAWRGAARAMAEMGQLADAVQAQRQVVALRPAFADGWVELGMYTARQGVRDEPEACFRRALAQDPSHHDARARLGHTLLRSARLDEAGQAFAHVLEHQPRSATAVAGAALVLDRRGHPKEAWTLLQRASCHPTTELALATATVARHVGLPERALPMVRKQRRQAGPHDRALLLHAEGELYDAAGDLARAWRAWSLANRDRALGFDPATHLRSIDAIVARTGRPPVATGPADERPVFVVGMPRSGTTLVESILAAHPDVHGAGELEAIRDLAVALPQQLGRGPTYYDVLDALPAWAPAIGRTYLEHVATLAPEEARRVVDKMPNNALHLALIAAALPAARVVWCERNDDDVALSCFRQPLGAGLPWATSIEGIRAWQAGLRTLKAHWEAVLPTPIHTVRYEDLVADPQREARRLADHLGLPYDPAMLAFHRSGRAIATSSWDQVREPIHARSVGRARRYRPFMDGLA
jgi:tetratricopeptide (TPR) repeat protein